MTKKNSILKPKDYNNIIKDLIDKGSIDEKYIVVVNLFNEDFDIIMKQFLECGVDQEEFIDIFINYCREEQPDHIHWILSTILNDNLDKVNADIIKKSFE